MIDRFHEGCMAKGTTSGTPVIRYCHTRHNRFSFSLDFVQVVLHVMDTITNFSTSHVASPWAHRKYLFDGEIRNALSVNKGNVVIVYGVVAIVNRHQCCASNPAAANMPMNESVLDNNHSKCRM